MVDVELTQQQRRGPGSGSDERSACGEERRCSVRVRRCARRVGKLVCGAARPRHGWVASIDPRPHPARRKRPPGVNVADRAAGRKPRGGQGFQNQHSANVLGRRENGNCGFAGSRVLGFSGSRVRGFSGSRVRGFAGSRVRGFAGSRVRGFAGSRVRGFAGSRVRGKPCGSHLYYVFNLQSSIPLARCPSCSTSPRT